MKSASRKHGFIGLTKRLLVSSLLLALGFATWNTSGIADPNSEGGPTEFTVRITNVSRGNTLQTSEGAFLSVPLAPGVWATHGHDVQLFSAGQSAGSIQSENRLCGHVGFSTKALSLPQWGKGERHL